MLKWGRLLRLNLERKMRHKKALLCFLIAKRTGEEEMNCSHMGDIEYYGIRDIQIKIDHTYLDLEKDTTDLHPEKNHKGLTIEGGMMTLKMTMVTSTKGNIWTQWKMEKEQPATIVGQSYTIGVPVQSIQKCCGIKVM